MNLLEIVLSVVLGDGIVMGVYTLFLAPKLSGKEAARRIKKEILGDKNFIKEMINQMVSFDDILDSLFGKFSEALRKKLQGTLLSDMALDKSIDRMISKEIKDQDPSLQVGIDLVKNLNPKYGKFLEKHPELAGKIIEKMKARGLLPGADGEENSGKIIYG